MMLTGDCLVQMRTLADNSIDAVVTDPPWNLRFMQKKWDYQLPSTEIWREVMRVLKPGGHALICCGTRTQHRMVVNVEDAGFEVRDICLHIFGSGFPKSHNISIAIDKAAGEMGSRGKAFRTAGAGERSDIQGKNGVAGIEQHAGITPDAIKWAGWGSALKPAVELWTLVRKPLSEPSIAANILKWGTGGLNIDASRIGSDGGKPNVIATLDYQDKTDKNGTAKFRTKNVIHDDTVQGRFPANLILGCACESEVHEPDCPVGLLDRQSGVLKSGGKQNASYSNENDGIFTPGGEQVSSFYGSSGGASRFFYVAKASKAERNAGLDCVEIINVSIGAWEEADLKAQLQVDTAQYPPKVIDASGTLINSVCEWNTLLFGKNTSDLSKANSKSTIGTGKNSTTESRTLNWLARYNTSATILDANLLQISGGSHVALVKSLNLSSNIINAETDIATSAKPAQSNAPLQIKSGGVLSCTHPTVKPIRLMEYLIRMITPPGGRVLDPFAGSGSTLVAAKRLGFEFIGIEIDAEYVAIAVKRVAAACL